MASAKVIFTFFLVFAFNLLVLPRACDAFLLKRHRYGCGFDAIYQLGDSTSDTGNLIQEDPASLFARRPYGETFFKKPTGRCSNGLLMIDYIAISAGIPFLDAYLNPNAKFGRGRGVNFAVAGSTALPAHVLAEKGILSAVTNSSLSTQLDWMFTYFNGICYDEKDCVEKLKSSLFMVGEIGSNDYSYALSQGKTMEEVKTMVPDVVGAIKEAIKSVIGYGARRVVVPGNCPIGCLPIYLTGFQTNDTTAYDDFYCLKELNNLSIYHNQHLQQTIEDLRKENPNVTIGYGDYYNAYLWILTHALSLGFDAKSLQKTCCGIGGDYNFSPLKMCGATGVPVCPEPNRLISWDGVHLTQATYQHIASWLIHDMYKNHQCSFYY
ncbi:hypothetical protein P3X46_008544 [Hevea brasiliensis]|uniref:Uncharacterized protein n=1 Tax=Hevea brasiliensis TaxID=3981 RepID=A0ABQ9MMG4_HEVBR|nr:acetylajmalan esterase-like [Hevea brasiliensis]KAJ9180276.1 hypothetical protein P3X46_008544 [Hevea brasiliensis]